jgi:hypothetical protein
MNVNSGIIRRNGSYGPLIKRPFGAIFTRV